MVVFLGITSVPSTGNPTVGVPDAFNSTNTGPPAAVPDVAIVATAQVMFTFPLASGTDVGMVSRCQSVSPGAADVVAQLGAC